MQGIAGSWTKPDPEPVPIRTYWITDFAHIEGANAQLSFHVHSFRMHSLTTLPYYYTHIYTLIYTLIHSFYYSSS